MNTATFLVKIIEKTGVDTAFSLVGGMAMHINRAVGESSLNVIYCNHEQAVASAAEAYSKAYSYTKPGLAVVTSGPGVTNTITSIASAYYDSVPLYILAGQVKLADINVYDVRSRGAQETPQLDLMKCVTKKAFRYDPSVISDEILAQYLALAISDRKGPVFVEIPLDIQSLIIENADFRIDNVWMSICSIIEKQYTEKSTAALEIILSLAAAKKPVFMIGNGLRIAGVERATILKLLEFVRVPALFTTASFDLIDYDHELNFGCAGGLAATHSNQILQQADLVVFCGVRLDLLTTAFNPNGYGSNAKRIIIDIDQNELNKNSLIQNALFYKENIVNVLNYFLRNYSLKYNYSEWLALCKKLKELDAVSEKLAFAGNYLNSYNLSQIIAKNKNNFYVVATASGYSIEIVARFFKPNGTNSYCWSGHSLGSMGLGLPNAIGAAAAIRKPVICIEGDGGMLLNMQELYTIAANKNLAILIIILNNNGYESIMKSQRRLLGGEFGASKSSGLAEINFEKIANIVNFKYQKCTTVNELQNVLDSWDMKNAIIVDASLSNDDFRGPAVKTKLDDKGKPISAPIDEISW